jgi:uncharacterized membrane protein YkgB
MNRFEELFERVDTAIAGWMARHGLFLLRVSLGVVFFWFGVLKFFPGLSPAEGLVARTLSVLSADKIPASTSLPVLAAWECLIGLGLLIGKAQRLTLLLLFVQMAGTLLPLFFFPHEVFLCVPYAPTLEGQYIIKNLVLISAAIVIGGKVRG